MRIDVSLPAWDAAALALSAGNHGAAASYAELEVAVGAGGGMAGDDATSTEFAAAYDGAAQAALSALAGLVDGYATLSRLTRASLDQHRRADQASTIGCADRAVVTYDAVAQVGAAQLVSVARVGVPSSRGGEAVSVPGPVRWVLDQVQGFCWPNADAAALRRVARAFAVAAGEVEELARHHVTAARGLGSLRGPEVPVASAAVANLDEARAGVAVQLAAIGRWCAAYADDVERHRAEIVDVVVDLLAGAVVVEGIGLVLGAVTAGLTTAGATAINAARVAAAAPRILAVVGAQGVVARFGAGGLELARGSLLVVAGSVGRLAAARVLTFAAHAVVATAGVGPINPAPLPPLPAQPVLPVDLCEDELAGGHTVDRHVGRSDQEMAQRLKQTQGMSETSTYPDLATAEAAVDRMLAKQGAQVAAWLAGAKPKLRLNGDAGFAVGRTLTASGSVILTSGVRVILRRAAARPAGFVVLTSFPDAQNEAP